MYICTHVYKCLEMAWECIEMGREWIEMGRTETSEERRMTLFWLRKVSDTVLRSDCEQREWISITFNFMFCSTAV